MLTQLTIRNFKRFEEAVIPLGQPVVFVGPNNSGKTTALQAICLWQAGLAAWNAKSRTDGAPKQRPGVTINRKDLISTPVSTSNLLWRSRQVRRGTKPAQGKSRTSNVRIEIQLEGEARGGPWSCGIEFDFQNSESVVCRPLRRPGQDEALIADVDWSEIPEAAKSVRVAFLPPMSGLATEEPKLEPGRVNVLIGQGQTAQVLRNLCHAVANDAETSRWKSVKRAILGYFGVALNDPEFDSVRGEIVMSYQQEGVTLDLASAGRGLQQTLLTLAHLYANPGSLLLLDEPDAHLEILRQREMFQLITQVAGETGSQIIAASHSEVVLDSAANNGTVVGFLGRPHLVNDRGTQLKKSLRDIRWDDYFLALQTGWVLYVEGETDLRILQRFAARLRHRATEKLTGVFVKSIASNQPQRARDSFFGLREAKSDLLGIVILDRVSDPLRDGPGLVERMWSRREIENYLCDRDVLLSFAALWDQPNRETAQRSLFSSDYVSMMEEEIARLEQAIQVLGEPSPWSPDIKATDRFLDPLFKNFYQRVGAPLGLRKSDYCELVDLLPVDKIDPEIVQMLDLIVDVAERARRA